MLVEKADGGCAQRKCHILTLGGEGDRSGGASDLPCSSFCRVRPVQCRKNVLLWNNRVHMVLSLICHTGIAPHRS